MHGAFDIMMRASPGRDPSVRMNPTRIPSHRNQSAAGPERRLLIALKAKGIVTDANAEKAGLQANTNFETDATITHVEAIKVWVEVSGGLHLDLASELYYRWPKECPPEDLVKLTEETGIQVGMP